MRSYRWQEIHNITGLSRSTVFRLEREEKFPKRRQLGKKSVCWLSNEVDDWLASRPVVEANKND